MFCYLFIQGEITVEGNIDREAGNLYTFTVLAMNGGTVPGSAAVSYPHTHLTFDLMKTTFRSVKKKMLSFVEPIRCSV